MRAQTYTKWESWGPARLGVSTGGCPLRSLEVLVWVWQGDPTQSLELIRGSEYSFRSLVSTLHLACTYLKALYKTSPRLL
jgi:hypothetical protein